MVLIQDNDVSFSGKERGCFVYENTTRTKNNLMRIFPGEQGRVHNPVHGRSGKQVM